jgi:RNA ligase (TIGR02306 family)
MGISYERNVEHCSPTKYVRDVTIKTVLLADNSDNLERILFEEVGWEAIARKGQHHVGESVFFIPPESVLPLELSEDLNVTQYLSKGRVKCVKLRGNRSEGLIVDKATVEPYLSHILQWEDPPHANMNGEQMPPAAIPWHEFPEFYKIPNLLNEPDIFADNEPIYVSEKIHGTNVRFGVHVNPETGEEQLYVGSHKTVLLETDGNLYWQVVRLYTKDIALPSGITFFGEIFGRGVQDLHYDHINALRVFAVMDRGRYLSVEETVRMCKELGLACVTFNSMLFPGIECARLIADFPSELTKSHVREGIVIREATGVFKAAKVLGMAYLTRHGKKTERH